MICCKCDNDLAACTCPDLRERFEKILKSEHIVIGYDYQKRIREQIERNERESTKTE
jgi:hypothetical protein